MRLKLAIFDVDGTLLDSQGHIVAAMTRAFEGLGLAVPPRSEILGIVGLSLPQGVARIAPDQPASAQAELVTRYKDAFAALREEQGAAASPFYPGLRDVLTALHDRDPILLGIATGKSRRGLTAMFEAHDLTSMFVTTQVADDHPSKPHPSMVQACLAETGVAAHDAVMIGDTSFDMQMAQAAGVPFVGVAWGYHPASALGGATEIAQDAQGLTRAVLNSLGDVT